MLWGVEEVRERGRGEWRRPLNPCTWVRPGLPGSALHRFPQLSRYSGSPDNRPHHSIAHAKKHYIFGTT
jgi:hypothetical protein